MVSQGRGGNVMQHLIRFHMFERFPESHQNHVQVFSVRCFFTRHLRKQYGHERFRFRCSSFSPLFLFNCNLPNAAISNHFSAFNELCWVKERFYAIFCAIFSFNWITQMHLSGFKTDTPHRWIECSRFSALFQLSESSLSTQETPSREQKLAAESQSFLAAFRLKVGSAKLFWLNKKFRLQILTFHELISLRNEFSLARFLLRSISKAYKNSDCYFVKKLSSVAF